jgi:predicted nucleic acid-binding protein
MLAEAVAKGALPRPSAASLKRKPQVVRRLEQYWSRVVAIFDLNIIVLPLDEARIRRAHEIRAIYGLLTNDSLLVAAALEFEIDSIATRDDDFDRVAQLRIYKPSDVF